MEENRAWEFETPTVNTRGEVVERRRATAHRASMDLGRGVRLEMIAVPGGSFLMGAPAGPDEERPPHWVSVAPFWMARHLITQAQWQALLGGRLPCRFTGADLPMENIAWGAAVRFCERLTQKTGRPFGLPSEAQWEYACRAGTTTPFSCGATLTTDLANYCGEHVYGEGPAGVYRHTTTAVGRFPPNAFGLDDLHGNVWEWTADTWHATYSGAPADAHAWVSGGDPTYRAARGGSWHDVPEACRSTSRARFEAGSGDDLVGFRVVCLEPLGSGQ